MSLSETDNPAATTLSRREWLDLRDAFVLFDTDQAGAISVRELRSVLHDVSHHRHDNDNDEAEAAAAAAALSPSLQRLLSTLDEYLAASVTMLTLEDFVSLLTTPHPRDARDEITKVYDSFDTARKGYIDVRDLRAVADGLGESSRLTDADLHDMLHRVSRAGRVTVEQFRAVVAAPNLFP